MEAIRNDKHESQLQLADWLNKTEKRSAFVN